MKPYTIDDAEDEVVAAMARDDWEAVTRLEKVIDGLDAHPAPVSLHAAALWYAQLGLRVFPLTPGTKIPLKGSGGCLDASGDADKVHEWWTRTPDANIGIATGHLVDVIDIDGTTGVHTWADMLDDLPPILGRVSTPRPGGNHLYVAAAPGRGNKAGIFPGVDYRGAGGYVVVPPSRVTVGDHCGTYRWIRPLDLSAVKAVAA